MLDTCCKHLFERAEDSCRACGHGFCGDCLVYAMGPKRPPYCIGCAIAAAGVRSTAGNRPASRRELRAAAKERKSRRRKGGGESRQVAEALASAIAEEPAPPTLEETAVAPDAHVSWAPVGAVAH
jgi:hypothetical protein